jgi:hypothetical protein
VSPCGFYSRFSFRPTPPCCQRRSIAQQMLARCVELISFTYERKKHPRLIMKTKVWYFVCVLQGRTLFAGGSEVYSVTETCQLLCNELSQWKLSGMPNFRGHPLHKRRVFVQGASFTMVSGFQ